MKLAFVSDIHFDHTSLQGLKTFAGKINDSGVDFVLAAGDISNGRSSIVHLYQLDTELRKKFYFVLGNHDFWGKSFAEVRRDINNFHKFKNIEYLTENSKIIELSPKVGLCGHDGWYDAENGNYKTSRFWGGFPDFIWIKELSTLKADSLKKELERLTQTATDYIEKLLIQGFEKYEHMYVVTHVPPFRDASWHMGKICDDEGAPFFSNRIMGEMLTKLATQYPNKKITVFAGHTHSSCVYEPLLNLTVRVASAEYQLPSIFEIREVE